MEQIKLDIVPVGVAPVAHASQFDNGRQIRFNLFNQGTPYTLTGAETVTMVVNGEEENITNTSDNYVIWDVAEEDCAEVGVIGCEIRIVLGSMLIGSKNFFLEVEMDPYDGKNVRIVTVGPADICTFETTLAEPLQSVTVDIEATGGNGTPDNPNPINGYTAVNLTACGVNLFDKTAMDTTKGYKENYYIQGLDGQEAYSASYSISEYIPFKSGIAFCISNVSGYNPGVVYYDNEKNYISSEAYSGNTNFTSITPTNTAFIRFSIYKANIDIIQIELGNTASEYHPYNGQSVTVSFGQTVYGGVLDVTRGKLKPCIYYPSYNGETLSGRWLSSEATYIEGTTPPTGSQVVSLDDYGSDIDLTPEVISAVVGENNVFAGCGETTVKYLKAGG